MPLLEVRGVTRSFYGIHALNGVDIVVEPGRITGLIGPNGAGKTTLFNCISGVVPPSSGRILFERRGHHRLAPRSHHPGAAWCAPSRSPAAARG
ncbi:MAG: ATP-binding cassette domain-containing protein [Acetobacteraceae bacterium]